MTEFPVVVLNMKTLEETGRFHRYVAPTIIPEDHFSNYVEKKYAPWGMKGELLSADRFESVLADFERFLVEHRLVDPDTGKKRGSWEFVTCGDWDLKTMLPMQCEISMITKPAVANSWVNIKTLYCKFYNHNITGMMVVLFQSFISHLWIIHILIVGLGDVDGTANRASRPASLWNR